MSDVVELSSGHVFAAGSVKAITPPKISGTTMQMTIVGVGFSVEISRELGAPEVDQETYRRDIRYRDTHEAVDAYRKACHRQLDDRARVIFNEARVKLLRSS